MKYRLIIMLLTGFLFACSSVSNLSISNLYHSDSSITESVQSSIAANPLFTDLQPISVESHHGQVKLSGYVKTIRQSDTAADIATKTPGVSAVENGLIVRK